MEQKVLRKAYENGIFGQLCLTLPKNWCIENSVEKGNFVEIIPFNNPLRIFLENAKKKKITITLIGKNKITRAGKIIGFLENGVVLDSGSWSEFDWIEEIHYELEGKKVKIKTEDLKK